MPCGDFESNLPHPASKLNWLFVSIAYTQPMDVSGLDFARLYVEDMSNGRSDVITVQYTMLQSPCQYESTCESMYTTGYV